MCQPIKAVDAAIHDAVNIILQHRGFNLCETLLYMSVLGIDVNSVVVPPLLDRLNPKRTVLFLDSAVHVSFHAKYC